MRQLIFIAVSK